VFFIGFEKSFKIKKAKWQNEFVLYFLYLKKMTQNIIKMD